MIGKPTGRDCIPSGFSYSETMEQKAFHCPHCHKRIGDRILEAYTQGRRGRIKTDARAAASRENGKKGGRPKGSTTRRPSK